MVKRSLGLILAGSFLAIAGCMGAPNGANPDSTRTGVMNVGFAPTGYSVASLSTPAFTTQALTVQAPPADLTYTRITFQPSKIELHYVGDLSAAEATEAPDDVDGETVTVPETEPAEDGRWIAFPVTTDTATDLMKLGDTPVSFGEEALRAGKYDQIRFTGGGTYEATTPGGEVKTGTYVLPSGRLYVKHGFEVRPGYETDLKFAFDAAKSMVTAGSKIILKPNAVKVYATYTDVTTPSPEPTPSASPSPDPVVE